jgi:hypothetical protein
MPTARDRATRRSRGGGERLIGARLGQAVIAPEASSRQEVVVGEGGTVMCSARGGGERQSGGGVVRRAAVQRSWDQQVGMV